MNRLVSVVVVNLDGRPYLERCLAAVLGQTYRPLEAIFVDNGSTDGSADLVAERFPAVQVIRNAANVGFAAANNQGIRAANGHYVATLNNDTEADRRWLEELVRAAETDERVGSVASKMLFFDRPTVIISAGVCVDPVGIAWDRRGGETDTGQDDDLVEVFGPCAGAALYRRAMLDDVALRAPGGEIEYFDEDYFIYLEDVDLAWRAQLAGWRCLYNPHAVVYHVHSATMVEGSPRKNYLLARNKIWTLVKDYPARDLLLRLPLILLYDLGSVPYTVVARGQMAALQGRLAAIRQIRTAWRKRRAIQKRRRASPSALSRAFTPLAPPWAVLRRYRHLRPTPDSK